MHENKSRIQMVIKYWTEGVPFMLLSWGLVVGDADLRTLVYATCVKLLN